jgi:hypothetical protein
MAKSRGWGRGVGGGARAVAQVVEEFASAAGADAAYFSNAVSEFVLAEQAQVRHTTHGQRLGSPTSPPVVTDVAAPRHTLSATASS